MNRVATSVGFRCSARLTSATCVVIAVLIATAAHASACSYVAGVQFVGFRGTTTAVSQGMGDTYDVDFVVTEVFLGTVPRHVKVRFVPAAHLDYVRRSPVDVHAIEYRGEFDWAGPCDSPDISTTPFVGAGYAPAPDPPTRPAAHGVFVPLAVIGGLALFLGAGYLAVRRSGGALG